MLNKIKIVTIIGLGLIGSILRAIDKKLKNNLYKSL